MRYSFIVDLTQMSPLAPIPEPDDTFYAKDIQIQQSQLQKTLPQFTPSLKFGSLSTDHLLEVDWDENLGWLHPKVNPYKKFEIDPMNTSLHYAVQCFEGMKAFKDKQGRIRLFRPQLNMNRLRRSCLRISLPDFSGTEFLKCIEAFLKVDQQWIPDIFGYSLYLRPTAISMTDILGVRAPEKAKLYCVGSPVGPYYPTGFTAVNLFCETRHVRAAEKGYGNFKLGSNYGPTISVSKTAELKGYAQILWLYNDFVTEVGTSNLFIFWKNEEGEEELVTPPADELILHGVTRDSVLSLTREWNKFKVSERPVKISEIIQAIDQKRLIEVFAAGTAVTIGPVKGFSFKEQYYKVPIDSKLKAGKLTKEISDTIFSIQYGKIDHPWSHIVQ